MKSLFKILAVLFLISCESESETTTGDTTNPFVGTWNYNNVEMKQDVTTNSDQTTIPLMGAMAGIVPLNNGFLMIAIASISILIRFAVKGLYLPILINMHKSWMIYIQPILFVHIAPPPPSISEANLTIIKCSGQHYFYVSPIDDNKCPFVYFF